jgi:hypothetical protein
MKTSIKVAIAALTIGSLAFTGCKKGEGDPFLSLQTRKARVVGEWTATAGKGSNTDVTGTETWTYDGTTQTTVDGSNTSTDKYTIEFTFEKDGTYKMVQTDNNTSTPVAYTESGTWNFTAGVGSDVKKKTEIVMYALSQQYGSAAAQTFTQDAAPYQIMDLYQLKSKEIIFKSTGSSTNSFGTTSFESEWTLTAK